VHINRSLFDETTYMLKKNYAGVNFPRIMNLNQWCLGIRPTEESGDSREKWITDPSQSMLPRAGEAIDIPSRRYELRAIITHYGRHENGHYICYRKYPTAVFPAPVPDEVLQAEGDKEKPERWYRLSDDDVQMVSEGHVMSQGGAFMLFYEAIKDNAPECSEEAVDPKAVHYDLAESLSNFTMSEDMSTKSTITDADSSTSRATSVSAPDQQLSAETIKPSTPPSEIAEVADVNIQNTPGSLGSPSIVSAT
jgi:ubiquitin carboxyl-terminal hydrolase 1